MSNLQKVKKMLEPGNNSARDRRNEKLTLGQLKIKTVMKWRPKPLWAR